MAIGRHTHQIRLSAIDKNKEWPGRCREQDLRDGVLG